MKISTAGHALNYTSEEMQEALRPITSLISKSEKAQQKVSQGTWQHAMLADNLRALRMASTLMNHKTEDTGSFTLDDLREALRTITSLISKTEKTQAKFSPGASQHTLQQNRLKALRIAAALLKIGLEMQLAPGKAPL